MIVYVESNFVLEIARQQETALQAEQIVTLAEQGVTVLVLPIFALIEPRLTLRKDEEVRKTLQEPLLRQSRELGRSATHKAHVPAFNTLLTALRQIEEAETRALESLVTRLLPIVSLINISKEIYEKALFYERQYNMADFPDAVMYAAIIADLQKRDDQEVKCFLNRNTKDFNVQPVKDELRAYNCRFIGDFENGLRFVQSQTAQEQSKN